MGSFSIPLSGLNANTTSLDTIANNLSNMSTTAFKTQTTNFSTLFSEQVGSTGSGNQVQVGEGTKVAANSTNFTQGSIKTTDVASDAAISGNGFFVVDNAGSNALTRSGSFSVSATGDLETADGMNVMGYKAKDGVVDTTASITDITIPVNGTVGATATKTFGMTTVLDSAAAVGDTTAGTVKVYDSLGKGYDAKVTYTNTGTNNWSYNVTLPDSVTANKSTADDGTTTATYNFGSDNGTLATVDAGTNLTITGQTASGTTATTTAPTITAGETVADYTTALQDAITAAGIEGVTATTDASGKLTISGANLSTTGNVVQDAIVSANATGALTFNSNGVLVSPSADIKGITFAGLSDGSSTLNMTWNVLGKSGTPTISTADETSATSNTVQDGFAAGTYESYAIAANGDVNVTYSNGETQAVGQLALANVSNQQGLESLGNSEYATTAASGTATIGTSGTDGLGSITGGALEESNVSISTEFSDLIIAQRAFEASSKAVTTFDTLTQEAINMIH
jgi:flagellar hook protein FlgE